MGRPSTTSGRAKGWGVIAALFALALNLVVPPGFMVGLADGRTSIVICTGHGPKVVSRGSDENGHGQRHALGHDQACAFAGHGLAAAPPLIGLAGYTARPAPAADGTRARDLVPGRGLAAPPPPSRGPPV